MSKKSKNSFIVQGGILAIASILVRIIGLIYRIPLKWIIGNEGNGIYSNAFNIYSMLLLLSSLSMPLAVSKLISACIAKKKYKESQKIFKLSMIFSLTLGLISGGIMFFGADFFAKIYANPDSALAMKTLAPTLVILSIMGVLRGYFQGIGTMIPTAVSQIIEQIANAFGSLIAAYILYNIGSNVMDEKGVTKKLVYGAAGGTIGTGIGAFCGMIFLIFVYSVYRKRLNNKIAHDHSSDYFDNQLYMKMIIVTITPVLLSTAINSLSGCLDGAIFSNIMKHFYLMERKEYVTLFGMYSGTYYLLINVPIAISSGLSSAMIPSLISSITRGIQRDVNRKIEIAIKCLMLIAIPCAVGLGTLAKPILVTIFGSALSTEVRMLQVGCITVVFYSLSTITNSILQGINQMRIPIYHSFISLVVHLILLPTILLLFDINIYGVVIADACFALLICILNAFSIKKYAKGFHFKIGNTILKPLICSLIMGVFVIVTSYASFAIFSNFVGIRISYILTTALSMFIAVVTYSLSLILTESISEQELLMLPKGNKLIGVYRRIIGIKNSML